MEVNLLLLYFEKWVGMCKLNNFSCECRSNYFLFFPIFPATWEKISMLQHSKEECLHVEARSLPLVRDLPITAQKDVNGANKYFTVRISFPIKQSCSKKICRNQNCLPSAEHFTKQPQTFRKFTENQSLMLSSVVAHTALLQYRNAASKSH